MAPALVAQGEADTLVTTTAQAGYITTECATGTTLDYRTYPGLDHLSLVADASPLVPAIIPWTQDRLNGKTAPTCCREARAQARSRSTTQTRYR